MASIVHPPRLARWLLGHALTGPARSAIAGDLDEEFLCFIAPRLGARAARRWYWRQTLLSIAACLRDPIASDHPRPLIPKDPRMRFRQRVDELKEDVVFALRQLRRAPTFAAVAVSTLALGIGANAAIFALADATLLRPLPVRSPDRLIMIWETSATSSRSRASLLNMLDWRDRGRTLESVAGYIPRVGGMVMNGLDGTAETVPRQWVTAGFFDVLGARIVAGRTFTAEDDARKASAVVLTESFWRARFGSDPGVVGRTLRLDGEAYTVVGVVAEDAQLVGRTSIWALVPIDRRRTPRGGYFVQAIGRMNPGVSLEAVRADLSAVAAGLAREFPATNTGRGVALEPLHDSIVGTELRRTSLLFLGVVGFVLLLCCANVANLLLARATVRTRELAIRAVLGAGRSRVVRQLLTESLVLAAIGGVLGLGVGAAILKIAEPMVPRGLLPPAVTHGIDLRVAVFCAVATILAGLVFGLAPAWQATTRSTTDVMAADGRTMTGRGGWLRNVLVAGEVATAAALLVGAGLLLRTLLALERVDRGFQVDQALTMLVDPLSDQYPTDESLLQFLDAVEREVIALPGVSRVAWTSQLPYTATRERARDAFVQIVGDPVVPDSKLQTADRQSVSPAYFQTLDQPLVAGRGFDDRDTLTSPRVCIVNEAFVRRHLPGRSPIGVQVALRSASDPRAATVVREIVGVAAQVKGRPDEPEPLVQVYIPMAQNVVGDIYLVVRPGRGSADALVAPVRAAIARVDRAQLVSVREIASIGDITWRATERHRFRAALVLTFAALALALAMVGVFGVMGYAVEQRVRDFAVRRALGATTGDVLRLVVGDSSRVIAAGLTAGLALAMALTRALDTMLFGVDALDPMTFLGVTGVLVVTAALALAGPARRAVRTDPATALRGE
jgi:putative ABC transport system permease protein